MYVSLSLFVEYFAHMVSLSFFFGLFKLSYILCTWSYLVVLDDVVVVEGDELADDSEEEPEQEEAPPQPV